MWIKLYPSESIHLYLKNFLPDESISIYMILFLSFQIISYLSYFYLYLSELIPIYLNLFLSVFILIIYLNQFQSIWIYFFLFESIFSYLNPFLGNSSEMIKFWNFFCIFFFPYFLFTWASSRGAFAPKNKGTEQTDWHNHFLSTRHS